MCRCLPFLRPTAFPSTISATDLNRRCSRLHRHYSVVLFLVSSATASSPRFPVVAAAAFATAGEMRSPGSDVILFEPGSSTPGAWWRLQIGAARVAFGPLDGLGPCVEAHFVVRDRPRTISSTFRRGCHLPRRNTLATRRALPLTLAGTVLRSGRDRASFAWRIPKPSPGPGQLLIRRRSRSVMLFRDLHCRSRVRRHSSPAPFILATAFG